MKNGNLQDVDQGNRLRREVLSLEHSKTESREIKTYTDPSAGSDNGQ